MAETLTKVGVVTQISEEVKPKKDGSGSFKVYNLFLDGKRVAGLGYSRKLVDNAGVTAGDTAKVTMVKKDGSDFWNVDSIEKVEAVAPNQSTTTQTSPTPTPTAKTSSPNGIDYSQINRREALKVAVEIVARFATDSRRKAAMPLDQQLGKVVAYSDHLVKYIETGKLELANAGDVAKLKEEGVPTEGAE
jgi:hypothetical protein